jgi:superfamily II DNA/RNA helicase
LSGNGKGACSTTRITYLVLDEADRMVDMGFGEQVRPLRLNQLGCCSAAQVWLLRMTLL